MYFVSVRYKIYDWSTQATILNVLGAILKAFCWICMCSIVMLLIMSSTAANPNYKDDLKFVIPIVFVVGIILAIAGGLMQKKAEKVSAIAFEDKVKNDLQFVKKMARKNPENKEWYINQNSEYAEYVSSGKEASEENDEVSDVKKVSPLRLALAAIMAIVFIYGGMYLLDSFK
jgi:hypothetical protein